MTADIRTAARECVNCGKAYVPTSDTQKFCESMCKRENYMKRRLGEEYAAEWRRYKELRAARFTPKPARVTPTREQIAETLVKRRHPRLHWPAETQTQIGQTALRDADAVLALMAGLAEGEK